MPNIGEGSTSPCNEDTKELEKVYNRLNGTLQDLYGAERRLDAFLQRLTGKEESDKKETVEEDISNYPFLPKAHTTLDGISYKLDCIMTHINRLEEIY